MLSYLSKHVLMWSLHCFWQNNSVSPSDSLRVASEKHRSSSDYGLDSKKRKVDDKDSNRGYVSVCVYFAEFVFVRSLLFFLSLILVWELF